MALRSLALFSLFAACLAEHSVEKGLRGAVASAPAATTPEPQPSAQGEGTHIGCSCYEAGNCQCAREVGAGAGSEADDYLELALLTRTKQLNAWWQAQDEAARMSPWSGPAFEDTTDLWVAAGGVRAGGVHAGGVRAGGVHAGGVRVGGVHAGGVRVGGVHAGGAAVAGCGAKGGCGCIGAVGCGCAAKRGCAVAVR